MYLFVKWMENDLSAMDKILFMAKNSFSIHFTNFRLDKKDFVQANGRGINLKQGERAHER